MQLSNCHTDTRLAYLEKVFTTSEHVHDTDETGCTSQATYAVVITVLPPWQLKATVPVRPRLHRCNMDELALHQHAQHMGNSAFPHQHSEVVKIVANLPLEGFQHLASHEWWHNDIPGDSMRSERWSKDQQKA